MHRNLHVYDLVHRVWLTVIDSVIYSWRSWIRRLYTLQSTWWWVVKLSTCLCFDTKCHIRFFPKKLGPTPVVINTQVAFQFQNLWILLTAFEWVPTKPQCFAEWTELVARVMFLGIWIPHQPLAESQTASHTLTNASNPRPMF